MVRNWCIWVRSILCCVCTCELTILFFVVLCLVGVVRNCQLRFVIKRLSNKWRPAESDRCKDKDLLLNWTSRCSLQGQREDKETIHAVQVKVSFLRRELYICGHYGTLRKCFFPSYRLDQGKRNFSFWTTGTKLYFRYALPSLAARGTLLWLGWG